MTFRKKIIFSSDSGGFGIDEDSDNEDVLQMDFELCIPLDQSGFHITETIFLKF